jgi:ATP-dependent exoDNAse (exonuclease V) alpha subunit
MPEVGDKIINLHNEWEILSNKDNPLTNGIIGTVKSIDTDEWQYPEFLRGEPLSVPVIKTTFSGDEEGEEFVDLYFDKNEILTGKPTLTGKEEYKILTKLKQGVPLHCNFGYAITVWKAQGSEWNKVLLFEEYGWPRDPEDRRKYMYTGITRAVDKLVVVGS